jgi:type IV pilus assembly protein PilY1
MTRHSARIALLALLLPIAWSASVEAQIDVRNIRPHVMLLVDTSGSMERKPNCVCVSPACLECMPVCNGEFGATNEPNRWALVVQALTGEFPNFWCSRESRTGASYAGQYDQGYFLPHVLLPHESPTFDPNDPAKQDSNGILDIYKERIKFGMMTFDSVGTLSDQPPLVLESTFTSDPLFVDPATGVTGTKGMFSYADNKVFTFPNAVSDFMINAGARHENASEGALQTVGDDSSVSMNSINAALQASLLGDGSDATKNPLRPFGSTPTGALVSDLEYFLTNDPYINQAGDPFFECRQRSAILITDGPPNGDMRGFPVYCDDPTNNLKGCPYPTVSQTVAQMLASNPKLLHKFYVIGFALDGDPAEVAAVETLLDDVASVGGTGQAFFVSSRQELVETISEILNVENPGATSRTAITVTGLSPGLTQAEFISGFNTSTGPTDPWDGVLERRRIECENGVPQVRDVEDRDRFQLVLNGQTSQPSSVEAYSSAMVSGTSVTFDYTGGRNLWTVLPGGPTGYANVNRHLVGDGIDKLTSLMNPSIDSEDKGLAVRNVPAAELDTNIDPRYFGLDVLDTATRDAVVEWVHGLPGTPRENERMGDIYHSTPAIASPLIDNISDTSYNDWRLGTAHQVSPSAANPDWQLSERPRVIYAATNDGVIHAFLTDDYAVDAFDATRSLTEFACANGQAAGTELWGFIAPMFLDNLPDVLAGGSKQWFADGNVMLRHVYDVREFGSDGQQAGKTNAWRTVLLMALRNGGRGIIALDVTNPCKPEFLWQFTDADLGDTYGQPSVAQMIIQDSATLADGGAGGPIVYNPRQGRGVVIVPGGQGVETTGPCTIPSGDALPENMVNWDGTAINPRGDRRCWDTQGRALYFIDLITGTVLRKIDHTVFPSPLTGAVSVFRGDTATIASAAYFSDADGILWRADMSGLDPEDWYAVALHDMYYSDGWDDAEPGHNPPVLSVNRDGEVVILHGTGNIDVLDDAAAKNNVVSITEKLTFYTSGPRTGQVATIGGRLNWDLRNSAAAAERLNDGEQVTGPLELIDGTVYFGTFDSSAGGACAIGGSRIFGVSFLDDGGGGLIPRLPDPSDPNAPLLAYYDSTVVSELADNLVVGLQVAQDPICTTTVPVSPVDPFLGQLIDVPVPSQTSGRKFKLTAPLSGSKSTTGGKSIEVLDKSISNLQSSTNVTGMADSLE